MVILLALGMEAGSGAPAGSGPIHLGRRTAPSTPLWAGEGGCPLMS